MRGGENVADTSGSGVLTASQGVVSHAQGRRNRRSSAGTRQASGPTNTPAVSPAGFGRAGFEVGQDWAAALELTIATHGAEPYKSRLRELFPQVITPQQMGFRGWTAVRALPYLAPGAKDQMREAVKTYMAGLDKQLNATPFGVPPSLGTWGGSGEVVRDGHTDVLPASRISGPCEPGIHTSCRQLHSRHAPGIQHFVCSWGRNRLKTKTYSNNRADNSYIPGAVIPGYIIIKPDFPECIDDFGFLWFEDEAVVAGSASWVVAGNAADAITKELK